MKKLQLQTMVLGAIGTNCYLLVNKESKEMILIDPADRAEKIIRHISEHQLKPVGILLTHGHFDHVLAAEYIAGHYQIPICAGSEEEELLQDVNLNASTQFGHPTSVKADRFFTDKESFTMAGFDFQVYHTPGHTKGGVCYYIAGEGVLFSGDTLFYESVGRSDFPTGSTSVLVRSIRNLLEVLPDDTSVYPGHGQETTIGHEKQHNPFI